MTCPSQPLHSVGHLYPPSALAGNLLVWRRFRDKIQCAAFCRSTGPENGLPFVEHSLSSLSPSHAVLTQPLPSRLLRQAAGVSPVSPAPVFHVGLPRGYPSCDAPVIAVTRAHTSVAPQASVQKGEVALPSRATLLFSMRGALQVPWSAWSWGALSCPRSEPSERHADSSKDLLPQSVLITPPSVSREVGEPRGRRFSDFFV